MLAHLERGESRDGMVMVRNGDCHGVNGRVHFREHGAKILVELGLGNFRRPFVPELRSTSQRATTLRLLFSLMPKTSCVSAFPWPPLPMQATLILSFAPLTLPI